MTFSVYIGGSWSDRDSIKNNWIIPIQNLGVKIEHDWTLTEGASQRTVENQKKCSLLDLHACKNASVFIAIMDDPKYPYRGTFTEIGMSIAFSKPVTLKQKYFGTPEK